MRNRIILIFLAAIAIFLVLPDVTSAAYQQTSCYFNITSFDPATGKTDGNFYAPCSGYGCRNEPQTEAGLYCPGVNAAACIDWGDGSPLKCFGAPGWGGTAQDGHHTYGIYGSVEVYFSCSFDLYNKDCNISRENKENWGYLNPQVCKVTDWTDDACNAAECEGTNTMHQIGTYNNEACGTASRCSGECSTSSCSPGAWTDAGCGKGTCDGVKTSMYQTRGGTCSPYERCVPNSASCTNVCGDGVCKGETCSSCSADCGTCSTVCSNFSCLILPIPGGNDCNKGGPEGCGWPPATGSISSSKPLLAFPPNQDITISWDVQNAKSGIPGSCKISERRNSDPPSALWDGQASTGSGTRTITNSGVYTYSVYCLGMDGGEFSASTDVVVYPPGTIRELGQ